jgi:uncharacterized protein (DUF885 family)
MRSAVTSERRPSRSVRLLAAVPVLLVACAHQPARDAAEGVDSPGLAALLGRHWADAMARDPFRASRLGERHLDAAVPDRSPEAFAAERARRAEFVLEAARLAADAALSPRDRLTVELFLEELRGEQASDACRFELWSLSARGNPVTEWNELAELFLVKTELDAEHLLARYRRSGELVRQDVANLRRGAAEGLFASAEVTRRTLAMVDRQLAQPATAWPILEALAPARSHLSAEAYARFEATLLKTLEETLRPALVEYRGLLAEELLPRARGPEAEGLSALPFGAACYAGRIRAYTTLERDAGAIHALGLEEIARIDGELAALGQKVLGAPTLAATLARLREDPSLRFDGADALLAAASGALAKAKAAIPRYFGVLPRADVTVKKIPDYEAPFSTIAYYREPVPDGSEPGAYYVNVHRPETRSRYELEALTFHESIPGHHLQIARAQELAAMPAFRRHGGMTVFVEGWALYTEQLADEMGLYGSDLDRMGMLSFEAWRAARLVVDTGLHALGWTRERARQFMLEHTALAATNIDNEVDRYVVWPGQALAYKTGQLELWRLRRRAESALGPRFSLPAFHDAVLAEGAITLPALDERIERWIEEERAR